MCENQKKKKKLFAEYLPQEEEKMGLRKKVNERSDDVKYLEESGKKNSIPERI